ncbi:MAG: type II toxin-antitoxin system Phd/YefM family antitoxin [Candidatus Caldatribacteriota bacterium]|nr:type II toxin-antitoxin system Phd/YefM family antitoxin [Candidatus Caldatribacteriota bacterium]
MQVFKKEKYIVDEKGKKTAAILPIKKYEELMEDLHDLSVVAERRDETTITFGKLKERLRKNGLLN